MTSHHQRHENVPAKSALKNVNMSPGTEMCLQSLHIKINHESGYRNVPAESEVSKCKRESMDGNVPAQSEVSKCKCESRDGNERAVPGEF